MRFNQAAGYLNDSPHRHSFNESIYSEPYSGRYAQSSHGRYDAVASRVNPLYESSSASNLIDRTTGAVHGTSSTTNLRQRSFVAQIHGTSSQRDVYGTQSSIASNYTTTDVSSTRSSIYSDKTILNDITPPCTPPLVAPATNPNIANASNASGSQSTQQTNKPINQSEESNVTTPTTPTVTKSTSAGSSAAIITTTEAVIETTPTNTLNVDKDTVNSESKHSNDPSEYSFPLSLFLLRFMKKKNR